MLSGHFAWLPAKESALQAAESSASTSAAHSEVWQVLKVLHAVYEVQCCSYSPLKTLKLAIRAASEPG